MDTDKILLKKIELIQAYKTSDGNVFTDFEEAYQHQYNINLKSRLRDFADKHGIYTDAKEALYEALVENIEELKEILK